MLSGLKVLAVDLTLEKSLSEGGGAAPALSTSIISRFACGSFRDLSNHCEISGWSWNGWLEVRIPLFASGSLEFCLRIGYRFPGSSGLLLRNGFETETMLTKKVQAISGVSPEFESVVEELYPSIACTSLGEFLNRLYECIPVKIWGVKISHVFALLTAPLGVAIYLLLKVVGTRYTVTNRCVKRVSSLGVRMLQSVPLGQIVEVSIDPDSVQAFYKTGDVRLVSATGDTLMLLRGVPYPERFRQVILETRDARSQVAAALARIQARK